MGIFDGLGDNGGSNGGLLGMLGDPTMQANIAMILKGLSPHSNLDPQQMLAQAQRLKLLQEERALDAQRRREDMAWRREQAEREQGNVDRNFSLSREKFGLDEAESLAKRKSFEAQQRENTEVGRMISGATGVPQSAVSPPEVDPMKAREQQLLGLFGKFPNMGDKSRKMVEEELERVRSRIGVPADVLDPDTYKKELTKNQGQLRELREGGQTIHGMLDQFEGKIIDPKTGKGRPEFAEAVGPFTGEASDLPMWDPRRLGYEATQSREAKAYMDRVKSDAQAINTKMQQALLKGYGAVTENERIQINQILGRIASARSPEDAKAQLDNFRGLVNKMFKMEKREKTEGDTPKRLRFNPKTGDFE